MIRHTRLQGDWSSDVCSSDLQVEARAQAPPRLLPDPEDLQLADQVAHGMGRPQRIPLEDRKSTRLNSSHLVISYAVFCLKKKKKCELRTTTKIMCKVSCSAST